MFNIIKDHIKNASKLLMLAEVDLKTTYSGYALSYLWAVIKPAVTILVYYLAFSIGLRVNKPVGDYTFFLWLIAGIVPWFYISEMISSGCKSIRNYSYLVNKIRFEVSIIPTFVSISKFLVNMVLIAIVIGIFGMNGHAIDIYYLQIIYYAFCMFLFFTTLSMLTSYLGAISKDFCNFMKTLTIPLLWLSGIMFESKNITVEGIKTFMKFNPITYIVNGFRDTFIYKIWFFENLNSTIIFWVILLVLSIATIFVENKLKKHIADHL